MHASLCLEPCQGNAICWASHSNFRVFTQLYRFLLALALHIYLDWFDFQGLNFCCGNVLIAFLTWSVSPENQGKTLAHLIENWRHWSGVVPFSSCMPIYCFVLEIIRLFVWIAKVKDLEWLYRVQIILVNPCTFHVKIGDTEIDPYFPYHVCQFISWRLSNCSFESHRWKDL